MNRLVLALLMLLPGTAAAWDEEVLDHLLHGSGSPVWTSSVSVLSDDYAKALLSGMPSADERQTAFRGAFLSRSDRRWLTLGPLGVRTEVVSSTGYADLHPLQLLEMDAAVNPVVPPNGGAFLLGGVMHSTGLRFSGELTPWFHYSAEPLFLYSSRDDFHGDSVDFFLREGLGSFRLRNLVLEGGLGKPNWGTGRVSHLLFAGQAKPFYLVRLRSDHAALPPGFLKFLGPTQFEAFWAFLGEDYVFPNARLVGTLFNFAPTRNLELAIGGTVIWGGTGAPADNPLVIISDYFSDADAGATNRNFLFTGRYWIRSLGMEPYFEFMMEDCCGKAFINFRDLATLVGIFLPRVDPSGRLDLTVEWARSSHITYRHYTYTDGFAYRGRTLGHPMGPDAMALSVVARYFASPRLVWKTTFAYEIRGKEGKSVHSLPISDVYPAYQVPDQRARLEIAPQMTFFNSRFLVAPALSMEYVTGEAYRRGRSELGVYAGLDASYLF